MTTTDHRPTVTIAQVNPSAPPFPVRCELCPDSRPALHATTCRVTFAGNRHHPDATPAERRKHGPGWWVPLHCAQIIEGKPVHVEAAACAVPTCRGGLSVFDMIPLPPRAEQGTLL